MLNLKQKGMTLIEMVVTFLVISTLSGIAFVKLGSTSGITAAQQANMMVNQIRHAQILAQSWGCQLTIVINATSLEVRNKNAVTGKPLCSSAGSVISNPATGQTFIFSLSNNTQFDNTGTFDFDIKGIPRDTSTNAILSAATSFNLTGGDTTYTLSISHITGFVSTNGP